MNNIRQQLLVRIAGKYSSTLENFHQRQLNQLIQEQATPFYLIFEDLVDFDQEHQFMKRYYRREQFRNKMLMFGEYYRLHKDKPRIVNKDLEYPYEKWHYKHRRLLFKELNSDSKTQSHTSQTDSILNHYTTVTHFLFNISTYNPYSKNYYLRKQQKQRQKTKPREKQRDRDGKSMESLLGHLLDNSYAKRLGDISFTKPKHGRYYSMDEVFGGRKSEKIIRPIFKKPIKVNFSSRKSENALDVKAAKTVKLLTLRGNKLGSQSPEERTSDIITKNPPLTKLTGSTEAFRIKQKKRRPSIETRLKSLDKQFSDKRFQALEMPRIKLKPSAMQKMQKANKLLSIKLKC